MEELQNLKLALKKGGDSSSTVALAPLVRATHWPAAWPTPWEGGPRPLGKVIHEGAHPPHRQREQHGLTTLVSVISYIEILFYTILLNASNNVEGFYVIYVTKLLFF